MQEAEKNCMGQQLLCCRGHAVGETHVWPYCSGPRTVVLQWKEGCYLESRWSFIHIYITKVNISGHR